MKGVVRMPPSRWCVVLYSGAVTTLRRLDGETGSKAPDSGNVSGASMSAGW